jgi:hypothetical protein
MAGEEIHVVATPTNGGGAIDLAYINLSNGHFVFGFMSTTSYDQHYTYHPNGYVHQKVYYTDGTVDKHPYCHGPPTNKFGGFFSPMQSTVPERVGKDYPAGSINSENTVYLNSHLTTNGIVFMPFVCDPGFPISNIVNKSVPRWKSTFIQYDINYTSDPWTGVLYWPNTGIHVPCVDGDFEHASFDVDMENFVTGVIPMQKVPPHSSVSMRIL